MKEENKIPTAQKNTKSGLSGRTGEEQVQESVQGQSSVKGKRMTKIGGHGAKMIMTSNPEIETQMLRQIGYPEGLPIPKDDKERIQIIKKIIGQAMGVPNIGTDVPDKIGFNITNQAERDVLFGVLNLLSETNYQGTFKVPSAQIIKRDFGQSSPVDSQTKGFDISTGTHIGGAYENIPSTPVLRITQKDLMTYIGYNPNSESDKQRVSQAVLNLHHNQNFLMYTRVARDPKTGKIIIDKKSGKSKMEIVSTFSPVLSVNNIDKVKFGEWKQVIKDPTTGEERTFIEKRRIVLDYYEISPSSVFLDQISREYGSIREGYFLMIPADCSSEIQSAFKQLYPNRTRISPVIQALCFWLSQKTQEISNKQRNSWTKNKPNYKLRVGYKELCRQVNIPESVLGTQKVRTNQSLNEGFNVAQKIGYIKSFSIDEKKDEFIVKLNPDFYRMTEKSETQDDFEEPVETSTERTEQTSHQDETLF